MNKYKTAIACLALLICMNALAQDKANIEHIIQSEVFGKQRVIKIFLPQRYLKDASSTFMVTYILDAQSDELWNMAKSNIAYMVSQHSVIPMIVVGIVSENRGKEFTPPNTQLQQHLQNEVFPLISQKYRVKDFRAVIGHSRGGAFVIGALFSDHKDLFDAYIGISPSFGGQDEFILNTVEAMLKANTVFKKYLYLSHGDVGGAEIKYAANVATIDSLIKKYPNKSLLWKSKLFEGADHWQQVIPSINDGLVSMSRNYFADQKVIQDLAKESKSDLKKQIEDYYLNNKSQFGFAQKTSSGDLKYAAEDFRDREEYTNSIVLFKMALAEKPDDLNIYLGLADTYDKMQEKELAAETFTKTLELLEQQKNSVDEGFYTNVSKWLNEKLDQN